MLEQPTPLPPEPENTLASPASPPPVPLQNGKKRRAAGQFIRELVETAVAALVLFFVIQAMVENFQVKGLSMEPTVHDNQFILVNKAVYFEVHRSTIERFLPFITIGPGDDFHFFHAPRRGEIVVLYRQEVQSKDFIKRIIGEPGDVLEIRRGSTYINGKAEREPYVRTIDINDNLPPTVVPLGRYFVMGDNRLVSQDSRDWQSIGRDQIIGKAWISYWPLHDLGFIRQEESIPIAVSGSVVSS